MKLPGFIGPSYRAQTVVADAQQTLNWYPERVESGAGQNDWILLPTPGLSTFASVANRQAVRGGPFQTRGRAFCVIDDTFYEINANGTLTARGTVQVDGNPATLCTNGRGGNQVCVTSGGLLYIFDLNTLTFTQINAPGLAGQNVLMATFFDQYFIALMANSSRFNLSKVGDGTVWNAGDVSLNRTEGTDDFASVLANHREVWFLGSETSELFYNAGSVFPLQNIPGVFVEYGSAAAFSQAKADNTMFWLGKSERGQGAAFMANGYTPQRISTHGVEAVWATYATIADAIGWTYEEMGHTNYVILFPTGDATWVYDAASRQWHERGWLNPADGLNHAHRARGHCFAFGRHLVGDRLSGTIYQQSMTTYDDFGGAIKRVRRAPHVAAEGRNIFFHELKILFEAGLALQQGQGANPIFMLRASDDGGHNYGAERQATVGTVGQYKFRALWQMLGNSRDRVWELSTSDPIPWRLTDAYVDLTAGTS